MKDKIDIKEKLAKLNNTLICAEKMIEYFKNQEKEIRREIGKVKIGMCKKHKLEYAGHGHNYDVYECECGYYEKR